MFFGYIRPHQGLLQLLLITGRLSIAGLGPEVTERIEELLAGHLRPEHVVESGPGSASGGSAWLVAKIERAVLNRDLPAAVRIVLWFYRFGVGGEHAVQRSAEMPP